MSGDEEATAASRLPFLPVGWTLDQWERWQDRLALEDGAEEAALRMQRRLDLLAWLLRQVHDPKPLQDPANWPPGILLFNWPDIWDLVKRDQIFHDLARWQIVAWRREEAQPDYGQEGGPLSDLDFDEAFFNFDFVTDFLAIDRPGLGGKGKGRRGVIHLVKAIAAGLDEGGAWDGVRFNTDFGGPTEASVAAAMADRLAAHPTLQDCPAACLSADAIRAILRS